MIIINNSSQKRQLKEQYRSTSSLFKRAPLPNSIRIFRPSHFYNIDDSFEVIFVNNLCVFAMMFSQKTHTECDIGFRDARLSQDEFDRCKFAVQSTSVLHIIFFALTKRDVIVFSIIQMRSRKWGVIGNNSNQN